MAYWQDFLSSGAQLFGSPGLLLCSSAALGVALLALPAFRYRLLLAGLLFLPLALPPFRDSGDAVQILFLDVGQGTSVLVRDGEKRLLYDTGGGPVNGVPVLARSLLPLLRAERVNKLDWLIISHPDRDHDAGEELLAQTLSLGQIRRGRRTRHAAEHCRTGERQRLGKHLELRFMSLASAQDSDNNASCVVMLSAYGRRILLPGDIDSRRERELLAYWGPALRADVLLAGHHGSASSTSRLWIRSVAPTLVVITAGRANRFGHPAPRVLEAVQERGARHLNTAMRGALSLWIDPDGTLRCQAQRHRWQPFWRSAPADRDCGHPRWALGGYNHPRP
jgi:competence protein ComEC